MTKESCHPIVYLRDKVFLEILPSYVQLNGNNFTFDAPFRLTYKGKIALEAEISSHKYIIYNEIHAWITTTIALAAFIQSFFF